MRRHVAALTSVGLLTVVGCHIGGKYDCVWEATGARPDQPLVAGHFEHGVPVANTPATFAQGAVVAPTAEPALAAMPTTVVETVVPAKVESHGKTHTVSKPKTDSVVTETSATGEAVQVTPAQPTAVEVPAAAAVKPAAVKAAPVAAPLTLPPSESPGVSAADMSRDD